MNDFTPIEADQALREQIQLAVDSRIGRAKQKRRRIRIAASSLLGVLLLVSASFFFYEKGFENQNSQLVRLSSPLGVLSSVTLPDGTQVTLNSGTTLIYPNRFTNKERLVQMEGEAFFDVAHDAKHPFVVRSQGINVRVLGTQFGVKSYDDDDEVVVTLQKGKVDVRTDDAPSRPLFMRPGQQAAFDKFSHTLSLHEVDPDEYTDWRRLKLHFRSLPFAKIARVLERRFNVKIHIERKGFGQAVFSGDFVRQENLEQILKVMGYDRRFRYEISDGNVNIK
jgi:ferric-dicitrate binding protein FerR (iron transport regulator)